jgi:hypothetical protein
MLAEINSLFYSYIDIDSADVLLKELADEVLTWAEAYIYLHYGVAINSRQVSEYLNGNGTHKLYVSKGNIKSIISLTEDVTTADITNLVIFGSNGIYRKDTTFANGVFNINVTYTVGYSKIEEIPDSLIQGLFMVGKKIFTDAQKNTDSFSLLSSDIKQSIKPIDRLPKIAEALLENYRVFKM